MPLLHTLIDLWQVQAVALEHAVTHTPTSILQCGESAVLGMSLDSPSLCPTDMFICASVEPQRSRINTDVEPCLSWAETGFDLLGIPVSTILAAGLPEIRHSSSV